MNTYGSTFIPKQNVGITRNEVRVNPAAKRYRASSSIPDAQREEEGYSGAFGVTKSLPREVIPDRRLARINQVQDQVGDQSERMQRHKRIIQEAEIIGVDAEEEDDNNDNGKTSEYGFVEEAEEAVSVRSERLKRALQRQREEEKEDEEDENAGLLPIIDEEDGDDDDDGEGDSSEGDDDSDDNDWGVLAQSRPAIAPRFVNKEKRVTVVDKEKVAHEEEHKKFQKVKQLEERKTRTLEQLKNASAGFDGGDDEGLIQMEEDVDTDEEGPTEKQNEFDEWRLRELQRVRRDREEREKLKQEQMEVEARRGMTDDEVIMEKRKMGIGVKDQKKINFLQKYYHKGAYYQDEIEKVETTKAHDWAAPVGEDKYVDRSNLPKVMQVKNFGRSGRTKYTHLKDQDTAKLEDTYNFTKQVIPERLQKQLGGVGPGFERPTKSRKLSNNSSSNQ